MDAETDSVSRRSFLTKTGAAAVGVWAAVHPAAALARRRRRRLPVYRLDPVWKSGAACATNPGHRGCDACTACHQHAKNKVFATRAATRFRAHKFCNCRVVVGSMSRRRYVALFGRPGDLKRRHVDRRWPWVKAVFRRT